MARYCKCFVLNVGQGSATFVVVIDDSSGKAVPIATMLADLGSGSFHRPPVTYAPSVDIIAGVLNQMGGAKLDLVVLSHSDNDHVNMIADLMAKFSTDGKGKPKLTVGKCVYGGWYAMYRKGSVNILDIIGTYMSGGGTFGKTATKAPAASTGFGGTTTAITETKLIDVSGLSVTTLSINAPRPETGKGEFGKDIEINTRSAILVATYTDTTGDWANFVITGDATGPTFYWTNTNVFRVFTKPMATRMAGTCLMTVPHHGSKRTATCFQPLFTLGTEPRWEPLDEMITGCQAFSGVASAGNTSHRHPRWGVLNRYFGSSTFLVDAYFTDPSLPAHAGHLYTAYFEGEEVNLAFMETNSPNGYRCLATDPAMFTTFYFYGNGYRANIFPPKGASGKMPTKEALEKAKAPVLVYWEYQVDESDTVTVERKPFDGSSSTVAHVPFVTFHPVGLAANARSTLWGLRSLAAPALLGAAPLGAPLGARRGARVHVVA